MLRGRVPSRSRRGHNPARTLPRMRSPVSRVHSARRFAATSLRVIRAVLRNPALRRVQLAFLLFNAVEFGTWIAVLLYAYAASGPAAIGIVALVQLLPAAAFAPVAASMADRYRRERVLLGGYLLQALAFGATGAAMLLGAPPMLVYVLGAAAAASLTFTRPTQGSLLPALAHTPEELTAANGVSGMVEGAGVLVGPLVAAAILVAGSPGVVLVVGGLACAAAALLVAGLARNGVQQSVRPLEDASAPDPSDGSAATLVAEGIQALARNGDTRLVVALLGLRMLTGGAMDVIFVLLALDVFHTGDAGAGLLNAAFGLGTVLGGAASFALVGRRHMAPALAIAAVTCGAILIVIGTVTPASLAPVLLAVGGIGYAACDVAGRTILQRVKPDRMLARVLGALEGIGLLCVAAGAVVVPILAARIGIAATLVVVGSVLPVGVALAWSRLHAIDRRVEVPTRELAVLRLNPVFQPLPAPQLEWAARRTRWIALEAGDVLIREGDEGDRYYIVESGRFRVSRGGKELRIAGDPGDGIGEIALLSNVPRTATVTAIEPAVMLALERGEFLRVVTGHDGARTVVEQVAASRAMSADEGVHAAERTDEPAD
jgi:MFS family permease